MDDLGYETAGAVGRKGRHESENARSKAVGCPLLSLAVR
jgi:hypothetical protein